MAIDDRRRSHTRSLRVASWKGDQRTALLTPVPTRPTPTGADIAAELDELARRGVSRAITAALHAPELTPFLANGFTEQDRLHLLRHDLTGLPERPSPSARIRRARLRDRATVLELDGRAFDDFWALDLDGLRDALAATPIRRFRVTHDRDGTITGYAITGRAGGRGYLQRLAVEPDRQGRGLGRALIVDALLWLRRAGAISALVNTQVSNEAAFALYRTCGFRPQPTGLTVLARDLTTTARTDP